LLFEEGFILDKNGLEALKIYIANCFGLGKKSYDKKLEWFELNEEKILDTDSDF
jgi:DNA-directed RNA polymerase